MRRYFAFLIAMALLMVLPLSAAAIGFLTGANSSSFSAEYVGNDINTDMDRGYSFEIGGFHDLPLSPNTSVRVGLEYASRSATESGEWYYMGYDDSNNLMEVYGDAKFDYDIKTISLPVNLLVQTGTSPFFFSVGGNLHIIASAEENGDITGDIYYNGNYDGRASTPIDADIKDQLRSTEFAGTIGAGVNFALGNQAAMVWLQYEQGLTDLSDVDGLDLKSNSLRLLFGVMF